MQLCMDIYALLERDHKTYMTRDPIQYQLSY